MTRKITTKKARQIRRAIKIGRFVTSEPFSFTTLEVMGIAKEVLPRRYRKVMVDVYHRNR